MKYDFTSVMDRAGHDAIAVDALSDPSSFGPKGPQDGFDAIPMWVADMNFPTVPTVQEEIIRRTRHPAFGYFNPREAYYQEIIHWQESRNGVTGLEKKHIGYENGVLGGVLSVVNAICSRGDRILVHAPTYIGFTSSLENNGYRLVLSDLKKDGQGIWRMDFADMEQKIKENRIHMAVFCSPHNPCGRVWERWEIEQFMEMCHAHDVYVVADEIWSDLILDGYRHIPTQSVSEDARNRTAAFYAPSKTFNLAGLVGAYHIIYNDWLRDRAEKESSLPHYNEMNVLSMYGLIGAYRPEGQEWLDELRQVLTENVSYACSVIHDRWEGVDVSQPQGTYMLFVDCSRWCETHKKSIQEVLEACWRVGAAVQDGRPFHGPCHIRMNLALPHARVREAFDRMDRYVFRAE